MKLTKKIKKEDEPQFTEWQVEKIRTGITSFRLANITNSEMPSLSYVAYEIESFRPENHANEPTDKNYLLKGERIRRFLSGKPTDGEKLQLMIARTPRTRRCAVTKCGHARGRSPRF